MKEEYDKFIENIYFQTLHTKDRLKQLEYLSNYTYDDWIRNGYGKKVEKIDDSENQSFEDWVEE